MKTLADRTIAALRASHDVLAALVPDLTEEQLRSPSGAAEWSLAQVLSHLGSGAEIGLGNLAAARDGDPLPGQDANQEVWDRWDAMSPRDQATGFSIDPPMACTARKAISQPVLGARLHSSEPRPKRPSPVWKVRLRPIRSPVDPPSMSRLASTTV